MSNHLTSTQVALRVGASVRTLLSWYKWYSTEGMHMENVPELPPYQQAYKGAPRFWKESDIEKIIIFRTWLPKGRNGVMGNVNARNWGDRGRRAQANKGLKNSK